MEFRVDSTKLGERLRIPGLTISAPAGWVRANEAMLDRVRQGLQGQPEAMQVSASAAFFSPMNGSLLLLSDLPPAAGHDEPFEAWARSRVTALRQQNPAFSEEWLSLGGIPAVQLRLVDSARVHFKFLLNTRTRMSLDYYVPQNAWENEVRAVESSLGSLRQD